MRRGPAGFLVLSTAILTLVAVPLTGVAADEVALGASKDNSLFEPGAPDQSNGAGDYIFIGMTLAQSIRRALLHFDIAGSVPAGSVITGASLTLYMSRTIAGSKPSTLHRLLADWGEGDSHAPGEEGTGTDATPGDATWVHTFYDTDFWTQPGGDFVETPSAFQVIGQNDFYTWTDEQLVADLQDMLDNPSGNFGWILLGDESSALTAKRFNSRQNPDEETRPVLTITFEQPVPTLETTWGRIKAIYGD